MPRSPLVLVAAALLTACASGAPAPTTGGAPPAPWEKLSFDERAEHMQRVVVPTLQPVFAELDPEEFAKLQCAACHGKDAKQRKFEMPSPDLVRLDPSDGFAKERAEHPEAMKLMAERVVPEMAKTLGMQPYDPATQQGFGCFGCHMKR